MTPGMNVLSPPTPPSAGTFHNFTKVGGRDRTYVIPNRFCEKGPFTSISHLYCFHGNNELREYTIDIKKYRIVGVEKTQRQYFDNLICNCMRVLNNDKWFCIRCTSINGLFLPTYSEPILFFCQKNDMENDSNLPV